MRPARLVAGAAALMAAATALAGCGLRVPQDPGGTLDDVTGGTLRVGIAEEPGLAELDNGEARGMLVGVVESYAARLDADIQWTARSEERLVEMLETDAIDLAVGGFTADTPWADAAGVTRPITGMPGSGADVVMLVQLGENAFLSDLERHLDREGRT